MMRRVHGKPHKYHSDGRARVDPRYPAPGKWETFDTRLYNATLRYPWLVGAFLRLLLALLNSNHQEPMPIGNNDHVRNLWASRPAWARYLLWRLRNPWEDLRKCWLGFGRAFYGDRLWAIYVLASRRAEVTIFAPWRVPLFPAVTLYPGGQWEIFAGFKKRGLFSLSARRDSA